MGMAGIEELRQRCLAGFLLCFFTETSLFFFGAFCFFLGSLCFFTALSLVFLDSFCFFAAAPLFQKEFFVIWRLLSHAAADEETVVVVFFLAKDAKLFMFTAPAVLA